MKTDKGQFDEVLRRMLNKPLQKTSKKMRRFFSWREPAKHTRVAVITSIALQTKYIDPSAQLKISSWGHEVSRILAIYPPFRAISTALSTAWALFMAS